MVAEKSKNEQTLKFPTILILINELSSSDVAYCYFITLPQNRVIPSLKQITSFMMMR